MKTIRVIAIALASLFCIGAYAQSIQDVLQQIESNNPALKQAESMLEASKYESSAKAGLDDPEMEVNYLFGANEPGRRYDFKFTQSFDFGSISGKRARLRESESELYQTEYLDGRMKILADAEQCCIDIVYLRSLEELLNEHIGAAEDLKTAVSRKVSLGDAANMDLSRTTLHLSALKSRLESAKDERSALENHLKALNGGHTVEFDEGSLRALPAEILPPVQEYLDNAVRNNPSIRFAQALVNVNEAGLKLDKSAWAPKLTLGYMAEIAQREGYRGITMGISLPLWSNSSNVQKSRARLAASKYQELDTRNEILEKLGSMYQRMETFRESARQSWEAIDQAAQKKFLSKAKDYGEISIIQFFQEMDLYYEAYESALDNEHRYKSVAAALASYIR